MEEKCLVEKGKVYTADIIDLGTDGEGIGKINGFTVFVAGAAPEEKVRVRINKVKKNFCFGELEEIVESSPYRVEPVCQCAGECGGCTLEHIKYEKQLEIKQKRVKDVLERIGGLKNVCVLKTDGMENPYFYRNKMQFPVAKINGKAQFGFYSVKSHKIVPFEKCYIADERNDAIAKAVKEYIDECNISVYDRAVYKGLIRHVVTRIGHKSSEIMVMIVINGKTLPKKEILLEKLLKIDGMKTVVINENTEKTSLITGRKNTAVYGNGYISDYIGNIKFDISAASFYQVNSVQTEKLYSYAVEAAQLSGSETVLDIYCGIGTISLFMAQKAKKVIGVEIVEEAIKDAKHNAQINGIKNTEFIVGSAEDIIPKIYDKGIKADVVVIAPPRKGCDNVVLDTIVKMQPKKIVYVSCEPSTFARDLKILCQNGYKMGDVQPVDQFCHSMNVETVVLLSHKKPDGHINVKVEFGEGEGKVPLDNIAKRAESYKPKERVTYKMIKEYIEAKYGFKVHTAYIAEVKRDLSLPMYDAPNAVEELKQPRKHPTAKKVEAIKDALKHFEII